MATPTLRAAIIRTDMGDGYPWDYTVDWCYPNSTVRNTRVDSYDYGRVATHAEAIQAVCQSLDRAKAEGI